MNKKRKRKLIFRIAVFICIILFFVIGTVYINQDGNHLEEFKIFTDIGIFEKIEFSQIEPLSPESDKYLKTLEYTDYFAAKVTYDSTNITVYAYVFNTTEDARQYFKYASSMDSKARTYNFSFSSNFFQSDCAAFKDNIAYRMYGGESNEFIEVVNFIYSYFPVELS